MAALMVQGGGCLRLGPEEDPARSVAAYVKDNPTERPMFVPYEKVTRWLRARGFGWSLTTNETRS